MVSKEPIVWTSSGKRFEYPSGHEATSAIYRAFEKVEFDEEEWTIKSTSSSSTIHIPEFPMDSKIRENLEEKVAEAMNTNHKDPVQNKDGSWFCSECGADSFDKEQFEEAAVFMKCPGRTLADYVESEKLAKQIKSVRDSMQKMKPAAEKAAASLSEFEKELIEAMTKPVPDPEKASAVVPHIVYGDQDDIDGIKMYTISEAERAGVLVIPKSMRVEADND